jgi:tRNA modification GTPase
MRGFRAAVAGEFTRRAFANGKLDLVEVEALGDILAAETEGQLRLAQRVAGGELSRRVGQWRDELVSVLARVEASIDFADEDDVGEEADLTLLGRVEAVQEAIEDVLDDKGRGERLREGVTVVIAGPPNAGKSSLLNVLAKREAAIVSPFPGTTRDPIEVHLDLGGVPVMLVDTAGLRETGEAVETIGVERARERISRAEFVLWLEPVDGAVGVPEPGGSRVWPVTTKVDLADHVPENKLSVSAVSGAGIAELIDELTRKVKEVAGDGEDVLISRVRQREELESCAAELRGYLEACSGGAGAELEAEHLRLALRALGRMTGQVDVEELLGEIFAAFCIGK